MRNKLIIVLFIGLSSCIDNSVEDKPVNLYMEKIKYNDGEFQWYYHSLISNVTPDWVVAKYNDGVIDTICFAENVVDLGLSGDTLKIEFEGSPMRYGAPTTVKPKSRNFKIVFDTTAHFGPTNNKHRNTFRDSM